MPCITRSMSYAAGLLPDSQPRPNSRRPPVIGDLPEVIHPIFARQQFSEDLDYELMKPALVLATKFISTPALLRYWHTVCFSRAIPAEYVLHRGGNHSAYEYSDHHRELTEDGLRQTQEMLLHFPTRVKFSKPPSAHPAEAEESSYMYTWAGGPSPDVLIVVTKKAAASLNGTARVTKRTGDPSFYTLESFKFAKTLVHELAHAFRFIVRGRGDFFLPHMATQEDGFDWENEVFGGIVSLAHLFPVLESGAADFTALPELIPGFNQWPNSSTLSMYVGDESGMALRICDEQPPLAFQKDDKIVECAWARWDAAHIQRMLNKAFWDNNVAKNGVQALQLADLEWGHGFFPRRSVDALLTLYEEGNRLLGEGMEKAKADGDTTRLDHLQKHREHVEKFYEAWNSRRPSGPEEFPTSENTDNEACDTQSYHTGNTKHGAHKRLPDVFFVRRGPKSPTYRARFGLLCHYALMHFIVHGLMSLLYHNRIDHTAALLIMFRVTRSMSYAAGLLPNNQPPQLSSKISSVGNLPEVIHPIFGRSNFHGQLLADYDLLKPAFVLATKFLSTPALLPFWHTSFFSDTRPVDFVLRCKHRDNGAYEYCEHLRELTEEQVRKTQTALCNTHGQVHFVLGLSELTDPNKSVLMSAILIEDEQGKFVGILISHAALAEVRQGLELTERTGDPYFRALVLFRFAVDIVHEVAHAVCLMTRGKRSHLFPRTCIAEDGYEWEHQVFGGVSYAHLDPRSPSTSKEGEDVLITPEPRAVVFMWPSPLHLCQYISSDSAIGFRLCNGPLPAILQIDSRLVAGTFNAWDMEHIQRMFTTKFWEQDVVERGVEALHPTGPRQISCFHRELATPLMQLCETGSNTLDQESRSSWRPGTTSVPSGHSTAFGQLPSDLGALNS